MKRIIKYFKILDWVFIAIAVMLIVLVLALNFSGNNSHASHLKVISCGKVYIYPLNENRMIEVAGRLGKTKIEVSNGTAKIIFSPCPNKTCMLKPAIHEVGDWIVCLPNEVFVKIEGKSEKSDTDIDL